MSAAALVSMSPSASTDLATFLISSPAAEAYLRTRPRRVLSEFWYSGEDWTSLMICGRSQRDVREKGQDRAHRLEALDEGIVSVGRERLLGPLLELYVYKLDQP